MSYPIIPITTLVPQQSVAISGPSLAVTSTPSQYMFLNNGSCFLVAVNTGAAVCAVNILAVPDQAGRTGTAVTPTGYFSVLAVTNTPGSVKYFGPFRQAWWNQTTGDVGYVYLTLETSIDTTNVTLVAVNF